MPFFDRFEKNCDRKKPDHWLKYFDKNNDRINIGNIQIKCMIIIVVQYTIVGNVTFIVKFHKNCNKFNIDHSPS